MIQFCTGGFGHTFDPLPSSPVRRQAGQSVVDWKNNLVCYVAERLISELNQLKDKARSDKATMNFTVNKFGNYRDEKVATLLFHVRDLIDHLDFTADEIVAELMGGRN